MSGKRMIAVPAVLVFSFLLSAATLPRAASDMPDAAYVEEFEKWKAEQTADLKANWLTLAGLFWLKPGVNSFGSDPSNAIVFPKGPAHAGEFELAGKEVTLRLRPDVEASIDGKAVTATKLDPDTAPHVTKVRMGSMQFNVIVRGERIGIRLRDFENPAVQEFTGMSFYPLDLKFRVIASFVPAQGHRTVAIPTAIGDVSEEETPGQVQFKLNGAALTLTALGGDPKTGLFLVFSDPTAKADTYPGGRFLDTPPVTDGKVVLDFNRAYNPPCAVTPYATCPLAPKENRLAVPVPAGEKYDRSRHAHH